MEQMLSTYEIALKIMRFFDNYALIVLNGGTHFAYLEQAARFNAIARSFLVETN